MNSGTLWGINAIVQIGSMFWAPNQNIDECNDLKPVMSSDVLGMTLSNPWRALEQLLKTLCINLLNRIWSFLNKPWISILESFLEKSWSLLNKSWTRSRRSTFWGRPWVNFWNSCIWNWGMHHLVSQPLIRSVFRWVCANVYIKFIQ